MVNCYLVECGEDGAVIVDPGFYGDKILAKLKDLGRQPKAILLTHGHFDHIGAVGEIVSKYPEIPVYIGMHELPVVEFSSNHLYDRSSAKIIEEKAVKVADGEIIQVDDLKFTVMHTPGHSQGGVMYICNGVIFSGDTIFLEEIGRCDLFTSDYAVMFDTLRRIYALEGEYRILPGHGAETSLNHERKRNRYMREAMER